MITYRDYTLEHLVGRCAVHPKSCRAVCSVRKPQMAQGNMARKGLLRLCGSLRLLHNYACPFWDLAHRPVTFAVRQRWVCVVQNPGVLVWIEHIDFKSLSFASLDYASSSLSILFHLSLLRPFSLAGKMENGWKWLRENQNKCFAWYIILKGDRWHEDLQKTCKSDWLNVVLK